MKPQTGSEVEGAAETESCPYSACRGSEISKRAMPQRPARRRLSQGTPDLSHSDPNLKARSLMVGDPRSRKRLVNGVRPERTVAVAAEVSPHELRSPPRLKGTELRASPDRGYGG